jgi:hypothetical protein
LSKLLVLKTNKVLDHAITKTVPAQKKSQPLAVAQKTQTLVLAVPQKKKSAVPKNNGILSMLSIDPIKLSFLPI